MPAPKARMVDHRASQPKNFKRRGLMFVLSSPSGAGKSTIANRLLKEERNKLKLSVSYTTRPMRKGSHRRRATAQAA